MDYSLVESMIVEQLGLYKNEHHQDAFLDVLMAFLDEHLAGDEFNLFFYGPSINRITKESEFAVKIDIRTKVKSKISRLDINRAALRKLEAAKTDL